MFWKRKATDASAETPTDETMSVEEVVAEVVEALQEEPVETAVEAPPAPEPGVVPTFVAETEPVSEPPKSGSGKAFLAGTVVGIGLGAAAALLFAPKSGEETRSELTEKSIELKNTVTSKTPTTTDLNQTFSGWKDTATDAVPSDVKGAVSSAASSIQDATKQATSSVQDATKQVMSDAKGAVSDATTKVSDSIPSGSDAQSAIKDAQSSVSDAAASVQDATKQAASDVKDAADSAKQDIEKKM